MGMNKIIVSQNNMFSKRLIYLANMVVIVKVFNGMDAYNIKARIQIIIK